MISGIKGKDNIPKKVHQEKGDIVFHAQMKRGKSLELQTLDACLDGLSDSGGKGVLTVPFKTDSYRPVGVYMTLVKMAITLLPESEVPVVEETIKWLLERQYLPYHKVESTLPIKIAYAKIKFSLPFIYADFQT